MKKFTLYLVGFVLAAVMLNANSTFAKPVDNPFKIRGPVEKKTFIHYKRSNAKPPWAGGGKGSTDLKCYSFLAKNAYWKVTEDYIVNASGSGMIGSDVLNTVAESISTWDSETTFDIFGNGILDNSATFDFDVMDDTNVLMFGDYNSNVIGVTNVWGYFGGPPHGRELLAWDMLLNTDFAWGNADIDPTVMDLENIVTHELGHALGLADQYQSGCQPVTMYGYSTEGETKNRDLEPDDITGAQEMYN